MPFSQEKLDFLLKKAEQKYEKQIFGGYSALITPKNAFSLGKEAVENRNGAYASYTIPIEEEKQPADGSFRNLLVEKTPDMSASYLITFYPTEAYQKLIQEGYLDTPFEGKYRVQVLNYEDVIAAGIHIRCVSVRIPVRCTAGGGHLPNQAHLCTGVGGQRPYYRTDFICSDIGSFENTGVGGDDYDDHDLNTPILSSIYDAKPIDGRIHRGGGAGKPTPKEEKVDFSKIEYICLNSDCSDTERVTPLTFTPIPAVYRNTDFHKLAGIFPESYVKWMEENLTEKDVEKLKDILAKTTNITEIEAVVSKIGEAVEKGKTFGEIGWDTIIHELDDYECAKEIFNQLPTLTNDIAKLLQETFGMNDKVNIKFMVDKNLPLGIDGQAHKIGDTSNYTIILNEDMLKKSTKEYILVTMYHEVIHAFLWEEQKNLRKPTAIKDVYDYSDFEKKYPNVYIHNTQGIHNGKAYSKVQFLFESTKPNGEGHFRFEPYINKLADAIISFNPKFPRETALAMAKTGIIRPTELYDWEIQLNQNEREGNEKSKGQKCN